MSTVASSGELREIQLIQKAARGDGDAFAMLFEKHFETIYNYVLWLCNDPDQAEDLTQETFIRAHGSLKHLGPPWRIRPWLYRLAHNLFIDHARQRKPVHPLDPDAQIASSEENPERQLMFEELSGPVHGALVRLSPNYREALVLREVQGFQYSDIAEIMGVSIDHVKVLLHRARASFKDNYGLRLLVEKPTRPCQVLNEMLDAWRDKELTPEQEAAVREHVKDCPSCQQRKRELAALVILFKAQPRFKLPDHLHRSLLDQAQSPGAAPKAKPAWDSKKVSRLFTAGMFSALLTLALWMIIFVPGAGPSGWGGGGEPPTETPTPTGGEVPTSLPGAASATEEPCTDTDCVTPTATTETQSSACECQGTTLVCTDGTSIANYDNCVQQPPPPAPANQNCYCEVVNNAWNGDWVCVNATTAEEISRVHDEGRCPVPVCGNGVIEGNEQCDGRKCDNGAACRADCTCPVRACTCIPIATGSQNGFCLENKQQECRVP